MDLKDTPQRAEYRARVRAWVQENKGHAPAVGGAGLHSGDIEGMRAWQRRMADAGLVGITWAKEYGGQGLGPIEQVIVNSELARAGLPGILDHIGVGDCGPTLVAFGTDEQKSRHLAPLMRADEMWCQLFSEPAAGSDLAAVQTRAVLQEDGSWRVNGQKVWTTLAQYASFGMLLARTNPDLPKHAGLTMFIVPMDAPGVTVRPLRGISGQSHFNEVFFDDVELGSGALLGPVDYGWQVALTTLMFERMELLTSFEQLGWSAEQFVEPLLASPALAERDVRERIATLTCDLLALRFGAYRTLSALERGDVPGPEAGLGKIGVIEAGRKAAELQAELLGPAALTGDPGALACEMPGLRSGGGTEEILRNTIGERVLGLPAEPRFDKGVPFSELGRRREPAEVAS